MCKWIFGNEIGLDLTSNIVNSQITGFTSDYSSAVACDGNGDVIFYTNGSRVYNSNNQMVGVIGNGSTIVQNMEVVRKPYSCDSHIIFTIDRFPNWGLRSKHSQCHPYHNEPEFQNNKMVLTQYDPVTETLIQFDELISPLDYRFTEKIVAIPKLNGNDYWILTFLRKFNPTVTSVPPIPHTVDCPSGSGSDLEQAVMQVYELKNNGINHVEDIQLDNPISPWGQVNKNLQNTEISICNWGFSNTVVLSLLEQNNSLSVVNERSFDIFAPLPDVSAAHEQYLRFTYNNRHMGCAFSSNGDFLYVSIVSDPRRINNLDLTNSGELDFNADYVYQINLSDNSYTKIARFPFEIHDQNWHFGLGQIQNFNDRIYIACPGNPFIAEIENPNSLTSQASVERIAIQIDNNRIVKHGLPTRIS